MIKWLKKLFLQDKPHAKGDEALLPKFPVEKVTIKNPEKDWDKSTVVKKPQKVSKKMPLKKSTSAKAFKENIKTEVKAGKPVKQAVAISYAVKKEASKTKKGSK